MAKKISITVSGLNTKADNNRFVTKCSEFWMNIISDKVNELPMSYEKKVEFAEKVVDKIHRKGREI